MYFFFKDASEQIPVFQDLFARMFLTASCCKQTSVHLGHEETYYLMSLEVQR